MSREKTMEEVREEFLGYIEMMINYWDDINSKNTKEKLNGLAFSILSMLDGCSASLPAFIVAPFPHKDDKNFNIEEGNNYYPENNYTNIKCDIAGELHEFFK